jgi:hypothetical protein
MFTKHGAVFAITGSDRIKTASDWSDVVNKTSTAEGIVINKNMEPGNAQKIVCQIDINKYIYIHTTIMASVDLEPESDYYITRATEKYINTNGDAWPRDILLKDYRTFVDNGIVYVEHDQSPEHAKGKVLDAIARDMGDTILVDLLFCVDKRHSDLVHNIETGLANAVSMGCTTKYTICSICGNVAHDEKEYCNHVKNQKNQMVKCADGQYRKACEVCFENTFYDCSIVANPAFAGAVFRKLVAADKVSMQMLSNMLCRKISSSEFQNEVSKFDIMSKFASVDTDKNHPMERAADEQNSKDYAPDEEGRYSDIPYNDPHNTLPAFDEQQAESVVDAGKSKKKTANVAKCSDYGSLVILNDQYNVPPRDRVAKTIFNFISKNTVGRLVGREANTCAIYFNKFGMIRNIPSEMVAQYVMSAPEITKKAKKVSDEELSIQRKGTYLPTNTRFQILKVTDDDVEVRWLDGEKMGQKEILPKKDCKSDAIKWASADKIASFDATWNGKHYQVKKAEWNEKVANVLDQFETHIDNVQHDITCISPLANGKKYAKSFKIRTKIASTNFKFDAVVNNDDLHIDVNATNW